MRWGGNILFDRLGEKRFCGAAKVDARLFFRDLRGREQKNRCNRARAHVPPRSQSFSIHA